MTMAAIATIKTVAIGAGLALSTVGTLAVGLLSPLGLLAAAVAAVAATTVNWGQVTNAVTQWAAATWSWLGKSLGDVLNAITDALTAGDLGAAAAVGMATVKVAWVAELNALESLWRTAWNSILQFSNLVWGAIVEKAAGGLYGINVAMAETAAWIKKQWADVAGAVSEITLAMKEDFELSFVTAAQARGEIDEREASRRWNEITGRYMGLMLSVGEQNDRAKAEAEAQRQQAIAEAKAELAATDAQVETEYQAYKAKVDAYATQQTAEAKAELDKAQAELDAAMAKAHEARQKVGDVGRAPGAPAGLDIDTDGLLRGVQVAIDRFSVVGTFSPAAVSMMGASNAAERTARGVEENNRHLRRIEENTGRNNQMVYS
jgi:hypothetical protein